MEQHNGKEHNFKDSLELSNTYTDAHWWLDVYEKAFPTLQSYVSVRSDGWAQRGGIDRVLTLASGKSITIDEKVRSQDWNDILLEYWSNEEYQVPGWIAKDLACDFIAYAFIPSETCYLLPFHQLRLAWKNNGKNWVKEYGKIKAKNECGNGKLYTTVSVPVPTPELLNSISKAMTISWSKSNDTLP